MKTEEAKELMKVDGRRELQLVCNTCKDLCED
jgi:hypothetical protein